MQVFKNNFIFYTLLLTSAVISSIKIVWISSELSIEDFGLYANITASSILVIMLISIGVGELVFVEGTRLKGVGEKYKKLFSSLLIFPVLINVILLIITALIAQITSLVGFWMLFVALCFGGTLYIFNTGISHYRVAEKLITFSSLVLCKSIFLVLATWLGLKFLYLGVFELILFESITTICLSIICIYQANIFCYFSVDLKVFLKNLRRGSYYAGSILARNFAYSLDRWLIVFFINQNLGGKFAFSIMIFNLGVTFVNPILIKVAPYFLKKAENSEIVSFYKWIKIVLIVSSSIGFFLFVLLDTYLQIFCDHFFANYQLRVVHLFLIYTSFVLFITTSILEYFFMGLKREMVMFQASAFSGFLYIAMLSYFIYNNATLLDLLIVLCMGRAFSFIILIISIIRVEQKLNEKQS